MYEDLPAYLVAYLNPPAINIVEAEKNYLLVLAIFNVLVERRYIIYVL